MIIIHSNCTAIGYCRMEIDNAHWTRLRKRTINCLACSSSWALTNRDIFYLKKQEAAAEYRLYEIFFDSEDRPSIRKEPNDQKSYMAV
jgi:hypothetical protein